MNTTFIKRINNVDIVTVNGVNIVPIKPICEALGVDPEAQRRRIKEHYIFSSTALLSKVVAAISASRCLSSTIRENTGSKLAVGSPFSAKPCSTFSLPWEYLLQGLPANFVSFTN